MLQLNSITKDYKAGPMNVKALKGVSLEFRENEFVCVLGPSGCGKTTLLNIIGGLDQYTTGDLIINGTSTKNYRDSDWDAYRNHSIGFVFQTYNLIPHQTVLSNVELALTLTGVSKSERKARAISVLEQVGLHDQIHKKPNQLSGGQMQRVAIARALVNNPDILLADEPTGSLDSETSVQIMEILKDVSKEKLVIMVTHNPELADIYSTRVVRLLDGLITSDSAPAAEESSAQADKKNKIKLPSMSFFTALSLSLTNLMTKKTRTFLTAFAGSIGIIGIALILSLSNGLQTYINRVEEETLSSYPITIDRETFDISSFMQSSGDFGGPMGGGPNGSESGEPRSLDRIYVSQIMSRMMNTMTAGVESNDLVRLKEEVEKDRDTLDPLTTAISYSYGISPDLYVEDSDGGVIPVNPNIVIRMAGEMGMGGSSSGFGGTFQTQVMTGYSIWTELMDAPEFLEGQYDLLAGKWPENANEVVLIVSGNNRITDYMLYSLGLRGTADLNEFIKTVIGGESVPVDRNLSYDYDEILSLNYRLVLPVDRYIETDDGWEDISGDIIHMKPIFDNSEIINIVGVLRPNPDAAALAPSGLIGYTSALTRKVIDRTSSSEIVRQQLANPEIDVFTGRPFDSGSDKPFSTIDELYVYIQTLEDDVRNQSMETLTALYQTGVSEERIIDEFSKAFGLTDEGLAATYDGNLGILGIVDLDDPSSIIFYPSSFENKDAIIQYIEDYNESVDEEYRITYTDYIGLLMSSVTTVIDAISYILIAFVSISLVVSSIMIGIITYISVLERTKEIGILRSVGASKRDISNVFNAETLIIGISAGVFGIIVTLILCIPANAIIYNLTDINNMAALPLIGAIVLILISMVLSLIAGLIPSRVAANKNPVVALRTE